VALFRQVEPEVPTELAVVEGLGDIRASTCGACHPQVQAEWKESKKADAFVGPLFQAKWKKDGEQYVCLHCHAPLVEQQPLTIRGLESISPFVGKGEPNEHFDPELQHEGITCAACHVRGGAVVGPHEVGESPHPVRVQPDFGSSGEVCVGCHQLDEPPLYTLERPLVDTHSEWEAWKAATGREDSCVDCHMPRVVRPMVPWGEERPGSNHRFLGSSHKDFLVSGLETREAGWSGTNWIVVLENKAGHGFPTADPGHRLRVNARWFDGKGKLLEEERILLARIIHNRVEREDSTLAPAETRRLVFRSSLPPSQVAVFQVRVFYDRMGSEPWLWDLLDETLRSVEISRIVADGSAYNRHAK
jgi:hypothetical protein